MDFEYAIFENVGVISLIPVAVVIIAAVISKRAAESLILGTFVAAFIFARTNWWDSWFNYTLSQIGASAYYIIMFGMFGAMIRILDESGAALGFSDVGTKFANSRKKTMMFTWVLGLIIFVEDYLNALGVGVAMQKLSDKWKISREMLAFLVNSTGASICILVPLSSWGILYSKLIEEVPMEGSAMAEMSGMLAYAHSIPYMLYAWVCVLIVPFFALGIIPVFGPMKKAEERALAGRVFPDYHYEGDVVEEMTANAKPSHWINFVVPMLVLIAVTIITGDIVLGVILGILASFVMLFLQKRLTVGQLCDSIVNGFKDMLYVTILVLAAFILQDFNDALGLTPFVIDSVSPILSPALFPVVTFLVVAGLAFCTGSFWGVAGISFPIILPLALAMGVNPFMAVGAVSAGTAFGSHACFYSDAVTVTCAATGLKNMDYARTSLPLIAISFVISVILYLILGFVA